MSDKEWEASKMGAYILASIVATNTSNSGIHNAATLAKGLAGAAGFGPTLPFPSPTFPSPTTNFGYPGHYNQQMMIQAMLGQHHWSAGAFGAAHTGAPQPEQQSAPENEDETVWKTLGPIFVAVNAVVLCACFGGVA